MSETERDALSLLLERAFREGAIWQIERLEANEAPSDEHDADIQRRVARLRSLPGGEPAPFAWPVRAEVRDRGHWCLRDAANIRIADVYGDGIAGYIARAVLAYASGARVPVTESGADDDDALVLGEPDDIRGTWAARVTESEVEPTLAERYWCGCVRHARWERCEAHTDLDHDEEPPRQTRSEVEPVAWMIVNRKTPGLVPPITTYTEPTAWDPREWNITPLIPSSTGAPSDG